MTTTTVDKLLEVRPTHYAGLGVFASRDIKSGNVIDKSVAVPIFERERRIIDASSVWEYYFVSRCLEDEPYICGYVVFGLASISNHSSSPNADISWSKKDGVMWAELTATKNIKSDQEVSIQYHNIEEYVAYGKISQTAAFGVHKNEVV